MTVATANPRITRLTPGQVEYLAQPKNARARRDMRQKAQAARLEAWKVAARETGLAAIETQIQEAFGAHILQLRNDAQQRRVALDLARQKLIRAEDAFTIRSSPANEHALLATQDEFACIESAALRASDRLTRAEARVGGLEEQTRQVRDALLQKAPAVQLYAQVRAVVAARQRAAADELAGRWTTMTAGEFFTALTAADVGERRTELRARATAYYDQARAQKARRRETQRVAREMRRGAGPYAGEKPPGTTRMVAAAGMALATDGPKGSGRVLARWLVSPEGTAWLLPKVTAADSLAALALARHADEVPQGTLRMAATPNKAEVVATGRRGRVLARWRVSTPGKGIQFYLTDWTPPKGAKVQHYRAPDQRAAVSLQGRRVLDLGYKPNLLRRR